MKVSQRKEQNGFEYDRKWEQDVHWEMRVLA